MIRELDRVSLLAALPQEGLETGEVGTVVHIYSDGQAYEVEFVEQNSRTSKVVTVETHHVGIVNRRDTIRSSEDQVV